MKRERLFIIDPVKPPGQSYAEPVALAAQLDFQPELIVRPPVEAIAALYERADALWIDWAVEHAVLASNLNKGGRKKLWVRLHAFEVLEGRFVSSIRWQNVTGLVAVSKEVVALAERHVPYLTASTNVYVIPNGVDCNRFQPSSFFDPTHLAWVGEITPKKMPVVAVHVLAALRGGHRLSMAGAPTSDRTLRHLRHTISALGLRDYVRLDGHVTDMPAWFQDKGVLLSTSLYESFGFAIGEAAAAGLCPIIFDFPNASSLWPEDWIVHTIPAACAAVRNAKPGIARKYVVEHYQLHNQIARIAEVLQMTLRPISALPSQA